MVLEIDGSTGEGGGQILRSALTLSLLTQKPFRITEIRARRRNPGLRAQHLAAVRAAKAIGRASAVGDRFESQELTFAPDGIHAGDYRFDIGTAGSCCLVLQTILLPLAHTGDHSRVNISGGTHVLWSPTFEYIERVWLPMINILGYQADLELHQAGFFPKGGGRIEALIPPVVNQVEIIFEPRSQPSQFFGVSLSSNLPEHVATRQRKRLIERADRLGIETMIEIKRPPSRGIGTAVFISGSSESAHYGYSALGMKGKPAERVADEAADQLLSFLATSANVDRYLADQLLLPLAYNARRSAFCVEAITAHLSTNAEIVGKFMDVEISVGEPEGDGTAWVEVKP